MESIFCKLSVYDIVRAGCTCTRLRAFISTHRLVSSSPLSLSVLLYPFDIPTSDVVDRIDSSSVWSYDSARNAWLQLSLAFLQFDLWDYPHPVASAGGLLCFGCCRKFVICNPITKSCRRLPTLPLVARMENGQSVDIALDEYTVEAFGLTCASIAGTYDLFVMHHLCMLSENEARLMHYSSLRSQWRVMPLLVMCEPRQLHTKTITTCNSGLYTLWEKGDSLVVCAHCNGVWTEIEAPDCTSTLLKATLLDVHDSLHMVGVVGSVWLCDDVWERPTSIRIWKLDGESREWMEVTRMPSMVLQEFRMVIDFEGLQWGGKNNVMYMKSFRSNVLIYDFGSSEWKWLKGLNLDVDLGGLIFEPSLSASA